MASPNPPASKTSRPAKARNRRGVRRGPEPLRKRLSRLAEHPSAGWGLIAVVVFTLVIGSFAAWCREQPQLVYNRTARETRTVRVEFDAFNAEQTAQLRENARQNTPRVYRAVEAALDALIGRIERLPVVVSSEAGAAVAESAFGSSFDSSALTAEQREALRAVAIDPAASAEWTVQTDRLRGVLMRNPLLPRADWDRARREGLSRRLELVRSGESEFVPREQAINLDDDAVFTEQVGRLIRSAGFDGPVAEAVLAAVRAQREPTFAYDAATTSARQDEQAETVNPVVDKRAVRQTMFARGDVITPVQLLIYKQELEQFLNRAPAAQIWPKRAGLIAAVGLLVAAFAVSLSTLSPWAVRAPVRLAWLSALAGSAVLLAGMGTVVEPTFIALTSTAPVALATVLALTVFDRLVAGLLGLMVAILVALVLTPPHGYVLINLAGIASVLFTLPVIRDRGSIVTMSLWLAGSLGLATALERLTSLPIDAARLVEVTTDAAGAAFGGLLVGGVTLFILPWVERVFSVTTGMTLVELRDPKQTLLRELQQKAPGTYNHSLNVATIAESAAAAIDADTLLTYAGALYHDIGKMTKPEYFVENQSGGPNRHDRLSPAMSVLVIIGHVKDGLELAREYGLPKPLHHFIEAHHGTTLVEYFFHRAKQNAEGDEVEQTPEEFDYRYPGPKPRTKEAAILMLADSIESATRTLREPTPSRIESLVEQIANKRLMDGQFDECDLTLRELHKVTDSISKTVASIYHGRVQYPGDKKEDKKDEKKAEPAEKSGDSPEARDKSA